MPRVATVLASLLAFAIATSDAASVHEAQRFTMTGGRGRRGHRKHTKPARDIQAVLADVVRSGQQQQFATILEALASKQHGSITALDSDKPKSLGAVKEGLLRGVAKNMTETDAAIAALYAKVWASQATSSAPYGFPMKWGYEAGTFPSAVHLNLVGNPLMTALRRGLHFPDNNGFVMPFILEALLFAGSARPELAPWNDAGMAAAVKATVKTRDVTTPTDVPIFGFWPQTFSQGVNTTHPPVWRQTAINMSPMAHDMAILGDALEILFNRTKGLEWVAGLGEQLVQQAYEILHVFNIPSDSDDTGTNVGIGRLYSALAPSLPKTAAAWAPGSAEAKKPAEWDVAAAFAKVARYSYCPRSNDRNQNTIDPRTYFWARDFFASLSAPTECIVTTWLKNLDEEYHIYGAGIGEPLMPFNVNNVDPTVAGNAIFGMSAELLKNNTAWLASGNVRNVYLTTARFVAWTVSHQLRITRPDLETLYYPATMNVMEFTARHVRLLRSFAEKHCPTSAPSCTVPWPAPELATVYALLSDAVAQGGMAYLTSTAKAGANCTTATAKTAVAETTAKHCWDGFLGAGDTDWNGTKAPHSDDRFFISAAAATAVLQAVTVDELGAAGAEGKGSVRWSPRVMAETPALFRRAVALVRGAASFLVAAVQDPHTSYDGVFFSGSVHTFSTLPFFMPANYIKDMNGGRHAASYDCINGTKHGNGGDSTLYAVSGVMPEAEYQAIIKAGTCAGNPVLTQWAGWNSAQSPWPFWSSPTLSHALAMRFLAEWSVLEPKLPAGF